tara:strand:- start:1620 stop:3098 length:1479 start_codon:yes stop_codon:yes gene_type:complete
MSLNKELDKVENVKINRRKAIKLASILPLAGYFGLVDGLDATNDPDYLPTEFGKKKLRLGIIGFGIRGQQLVRALGFATPQWVDKAKKRNSYQAFRNQKDLEIIFTGVCDIFDPRAENALRTLGKTAKRYLNYKDMLSSPDIDAVLIATPDHLHARMIIDAAQAGKHVYVEKCMTHTIEEVYEVYEAVKKSGITFQLGHQLRQKDSFIQAKDLLHLDILGKTTLVQATTNRNSPNAAWVYDIPPEASEENVDWKQFDPDRSFDLDRFFRWRKYWDYGTGISGDLLTHEFDSLNFIMDMGIPHSAIASGGIYFYKDGREVPDVFQVVFEFPEKNLTILYSATFANDSHRPTLIMGHNATMHLDNSIEIWANANSTKYKEKLARGIMKTNKPFYVYPSKETDSVDGISGATSQYFSKKGMMNTYREGKNVDPTRLHIIEWILCIQNGWQTSCDIKAGFAEAIAAHMATLSLKTGKKVYWKESERKVVFELENNK